MSEKSTLNKIVKDIIMEQSHVIGMGLSVSRAKDTGLINVDETNVDSLQVNE